MAYFDSSKNRALWEIRLGELKKERAAREAGGGGGGVVGGPRGFKRESPPARICDEGF